MAGVKHPINPNHRVQEGHLHIWSLLHSINMIYGCFLHPAIGQPMGRTIQNHRGPCLSCSHGKAERWEPRHPTIRRQRALGAARANVPTRRPRLTSHLDLEIEFEILPVSRSLCDCGSLP